MSNSKITYDMASLGLMKTFENMTRARIKDCIIEEERIIFIVQEGDLLKGLGKKAENIRILGEKFKKKVKVVEYKPELLAFIKSFINPLKVDEIREEDKIVILQSQDTKTKGMIIGRAAKNLRALEEHVRRFFPELKEIKVV